ncbi:MAG TPA: Spy/CpxP family protein refolding chaperone [Xanthobacteraceae bacterium]|nr:Spy/CpxP family protein refolding chaperone [Xanthobacteraceae bacterium]
MKRLSLVLASTILLIASVRIDPSVAQQTSTSNRAAPSANLVLIPGAMAGARTMGPTGYRRLCAPLSVGLYEWRMQWIERLLKPTDAQKTPLNDLLGASTKARETIAAACPRETVETTTVQLAVMERRVAGLLDALKIVRPAYDTFYASLDSQQKARLDALGPGRHGWRW